MASSRGPDLFPIYDVLGMLGGMSGERGQTGIVGAAFEFEAEHEAHDADHGSLGQVREAHHALDVRLAGLIELLTTTRSAYMDLAQRAETRYARQAQANVTRLGGEDR